MDETHRCMGSKEPFPMKNECIFSKWKAGGWTTAIPIGAFLGPGVDEWKKRGHVLRIRREGE